MVGAGLHSQPVAFGPSHRHHAVGAVAAELLLLLVSRGGAPATLAFVAVAVALVDLDNWLDLGVVVRPIGAHVRAGRVCHGDALVLAQVCEEALGSLAGIVGRQRPLIVLVVEDRSAAVREDHVAVSVGVLDRALVGEQRNERRTDAEDVDELLAAEPVVFVGHAEVVLGDGEEIQRARIDRVAVSVLGRAVVVAVPGDLRVAVHVAAVDLVALAADIVDIAADARHVLLVVGVYGFAGGHFAARPVGRLPRCLHGRQAQACQAMGFCLAGQGRQPRGEHVEHDVDEIAETPPVRRVRGDQAAG